MTKITEHERVEFEKEQIKNKVSILIVCYNDFNLIEVLYDDIHSQNHPDIETIWVLNGKNKRSKEFLEEKNEITVEPEKNTWYSGGNNLAASVSSGEFLFVLNADTRIEQNTIEELVKSAKKTDAAVYVPKTMCEPSRKTIDSIGKSISAAGWVGRIGAGERDNGQYDMPLIVPAFDGAAFMIRRSVVEEIGFFDTRFTVFEETNDLSFRLYGSGYRIVTVPNSVVYHYGGKSYESTISRSETFQYYGTKNDIITIFKNFNLLYLLFVLPVHIIWPLRAAFYLSINKEPRLGFMRIKGLVSGLLLGMKSINRNLTLRQQYDIIFNLPERIHSNHSE
jgi:GT2 family glycosyltransferase